jgi:hypothetical protein
MPSALLGEVVPRARPLREEEGAGLSGGNGTAVASTGLSNLVSLSWNASSICLAWAAVKLLLGPITRCAQVAASSAEPISLSSQASWNRVFFSRRDQSSPVRWTTSVKRADIDFLKVSV